MDKKKLAIFASGSGTNAENIIKYFAENESIEVDSLWASNAEAYALQRASNHGVDTFIITRKQLRETNEIVSALKNRKVEVIVLAGFLWLIPENLIKNFTLVNIHPALLPKYGGKGMYGMHVHKAVVANKEKESGITIHFVNENYDEGQIIFQAKCKVLPGDSAEDVAAKVHQLEYKHFPQTIEKVLKSL